MSYTPLDDSYRLDTLRRLALLDSKIEVSFDRLTRLASEIIAAPVCLVSLVDHERQFFKSAHGLGGEAGEKRETPLTHSFCQHVVTSGEPLIVSDAPNHPQVCENLAIRDLGVIAYLGMPIRAPNGCVLGSFCVIDTKPRDWTDIEIDRTREFASLVETEISLRSTLIEHRAGIARQQALLTGASISVVMTTLTGKIEVFSVGARRLLGFTAEEMIGKNISEIHLPEDVSAKAAALSLRHDREIPPDFEVFTTLANDPTADNSDWTYVCKDDSRVSGQLSITPVLDSTNVVIGYLGVIQDTTEQKKAKAVLEVTRSQLEKTFASMSEGLVLQSASGEILECNTAAEKILGLSRDQMAGRTSMDPAWRSIHEDESPYPGEQHPSMITLSTGEPQRNVIMGVHKTDHSLTWIEINTELVGRPGQHDREVVCSFRDITDRRSAELAMRESEERFRTLTQNAPVGIFQTDAAGHCQFVNERWVEISGISAAEAAGDGWQSALHPEDRESLYSRWATYSEGDKPFELKYRFKHQNGRVVWVFGRAVPLIDHLGNISGHIGTISDITEQREHESNLAFTRDQALEASQLKSEFLAIMSHEIRTPMNAIIGMAELLSDTPLTPDQTDMTRMLTSGAESLLVIINDILDFSRIEAGQMRLDLADFHLETLIQDTVALLVPKAKEKGLRLTCEFESTPDCLLFGDSGRVRQILTNLLGNAIKFTDEGEIRVTGKSLSSEAGNVRINLAVQDSGVGIPADSHHKLFEPFIQIDGSNTRRFGGTGLGLAITQQLVASMNGEIGVESELGAGSTFWLNLPFPCGAPLEDCLADSSPSVSDDEIPPDPSSGDLPRLRILNVEDVRVNQVVLTKMLKKWGHMVESVDNGQEALDVLVTQSFDLVLMDCQMPVLDGYETTKIIRSGALVGIDSSIPIFAVTASARKEDQVECLAVGMDEFLTKPIRTDALKALFGKYGYRVSAL